MPYDLELQRRGQWMRALSQLREMLPGSFVQRGRKCGKPGCRCVDGQQLHPEFLLSVLINGKPKTYHIPNHLAEEVRSKVELRKRFEATAAKITQLNLQRFLRPKEKP